MMEENTRKGQWGMTSSSLDEMNSDIAHGSYDGIPGKPLSTITLNI